jgi:hypothetical protein
MRHRRSVAGLASLVLALLVCAGCTGSHKRVAAAQRSIRQSVGPQFPAPTVTPTYKEPSTTTCGAWGAQATSPSGTVALLSCMGTAGGSEVRIITVKVGDEVLISGLDTDTRATLKPMPANLLQRSGRLFLAKARGTTTLIIAGWLCNSTHPGGSQPSSCPLVKIVAS